MASYMQSYWDPNGEQDKDSLGMLARAQMPSDMQDPPAPSAPAANPTPEPPDPGYAQPPPEANTDPDTGQPQPPQQGPGGRAPATGGALDQLYSQYPGLKQYDIQTLDSSVGGKDWKGQPYNGRQMEFYPPDETDNPNPGKPTIEDFSGHLNPKDALGEVFSHYLPKQDPRFGAARDRFIQSIDAKQRGMLQGDYQQDIRSGVYGTKRPSFDEWLNNQGGDAFFRGYVADQYPKEFYRPDQVEIFKPLLAQLRGAPGQSQQGPAQLPKEDVLSSLSRATEQPSTDLSQPAGQNPLAPSMFGYAGAPAQGPRPQLPEAPQLSAPNGWALGGAALLDMFLNRGRHTGEILGAIAQGTNPTDQQNFHNQLERAKSQAQIDHLYAQGGDPMQNALRLQNLELSRQRLGNAVDREHRLENILRDKGDPHKADKLREYYYAEDPSLTGTLDSMNEEQLTKLAPALRERIRTSGSGADRAANAAALKGKAVAQATAPTKVQNAIEIARGTAPIKVDTAGKSAAASAAARLPYDEAKADYSVGTAQAKGQNASAARAKEKAGATDQGDQEVSDIEALHPWLTFAGDEGARQYKRRGANRFSQKARDEDLQLTDQMVNASASMNLLIRDYRNALKSADPHDMARVGAEYAQYRNEHAGIIRKIGKESNAAGVGEHIREELPTKLGLLAPDEMEGIANFLHEQSNARMITNGISVRDDMSPDDIVSAFKNLRSKRRSVTAPGQARSGAPTASASPAAPTTVTATADGLIDDNGDEWK